MASGPVLDQVTAIEEALAVKPLHERVAGIARGTLIIREYSDDLASDFYEINAEWITSMFCLEQTDREVLENPKERIIAPGGTILFVEAPNLGVVGACALQKTGATNFELTKMGV